MPVETKVEKLEKLFAEAEAKRKAATNQREINIQVLALAKLTEKLIEARRVVGTRTKKAAVLKTLLSAKMNRAEVFKAKLAVLSGEIADLEVLLKEALAKEG